jgi:hypothetical protein
MSIRMASRGDDPPRRAWTVDGLPCATYVGGTGGLCGYVRLPQGHRHLTAAVRAPTAWTYGPDGEGWVGYHTAHAGHYWSPEDLLTFTEGREAPRAMVELEISFGEFTSDLPGQRWTEESFEQALEQVARRLACQIRRR